ncbi:hypothetical protein C0J52_14365 [Blattella germanica]|nr:hypothetical protein C0J52_14365 [Blattella germanica]
MVGEHTMMQTLAFLVCAVVAATAETCDPYYSDICADHTMCIYPEVGEACGKVHTRGVASQAEIQEILEQHNKYRSKVALGHATRGNPGPQSSVANMNQLVHSKLFYPFTRFLGNIVGHNVYGMSSGDIMDANWTAAVETWFEEIKKIQPSKHRSFRVSRLRTTTKQPTTLSSFRPIRRWSDAVTRHTKLQVARTTNITFATMELTETLRAQVSACTRKENPVQPALIAATLQLDFANTSNS